MYRDEYPPEPLYYGYDPEPDIPERWHYTDGMPDKPVSPNLLSDRVIEQLESYGLVIPKKTPGMVQDLCKGFNQCIKDNHSGELVTYVFSPKTGSAKSVTAKMYIALLEKESSIVVVSTVADAIEFCSDINNWSKDKDYARCYYRISDDNPDNSLRVEKAMLQSYRCIAITHSMFIRGNKENEIGLFQLYGGVTRSLNVIDERIGLYDRHTIDKRVVEALLFGFKGISMRDTIKIDLEIKTLQTLLDMFEKLDSNALESKSSTVLVNDEILDDLIVPKTDFSYIKSLIKDSKIDITHFNALVQKSSARGNDELSLSIVNHLSSVEYILSHKFSFHKLGAVHLLMATENIINKFGSCVVLDATATINQIYETTSWHNQDTFKHIITEDPRIYSNFTIYKAKGYAQGADSVYKKLDANEKRDRANEYLSIAYEIVSSEEDKMLIIGHKDFVLTLQSLNTNNQIVFTNWGNHVGKNNWSDCNKVMVIGWWYKPETEYYGNFINAVGNLEHASHAIRDSTRNLYRETQLADDLVQAVMRCSARKTVSEDGNCTPAEAYIFYSIKEEKALKIFESEFKGAIIKEWLPKFKKIQQKVTKHDSNVASVMEYLEQASKKALDVSQPDIVTATGLAKAIVSRTLNSDECQAEFKRLGYTKVAAKGKPTIIHFS